ncbi:GntR family transcriptional regulator [Rhodobacter veldkampii DSM 11550]|uniref:GntR family transcriptional regulator n=1 Tax=Phaeovulum veldkampii DSM 11550 TaxID=1185920 RepID=A0A2T4JFY3_9RHOB|nr:GntR family transcriptional regulator [Phaeovulum veldkampii]MBK5945160.1 GntR family transcriptional regulator [Phaeovulum veldkampii DSM 11550]NCU19584.1 GntR family transcriptional regulator [Candidatus Falkowbacteria bacterium]PTE16811.1 GntR family transcriptional regulator [Phaeovulum veldkampii DSM 11550]TDQ54668.1 DNA-binding GntR family transcriptional regulator [Phaeovulum veldkampii DSM 11550]
MTKARKIPTHELTYAALSDMVLFGHLAPGQPVTIQGLVRDLGAGMTPVREAIRRLSSQGALKPQGNRRVVVPRLGLADLDQLAFARLTIEPKLAELALPGLTPEAVAVLRALDGAVDAAIAAGDVPGYLEANHRFHFMLYSASGAQVLVDIARSLWLRFGPSLRVVCGAADTAALPDRHGEALAALETGDATALARAIGNDIAQGINQVRAALLAGAI